MKIELPSLEKIPKGSSTTIGGPVYWRTTKQIRRKAKDILSTPRGEELDRWLKEAESLPQPNQERARTNEQGWSNHLFHTGPFINRIYPHTVGQVMRYEYHWPITWYKCPTCGLICFYICNHAVATCKHVFCYVLPQIVPKSFRDKNEGCKILMGRNPYWIHNPRFRVGYKKFKDEEEKPDRLPGEAYTLSL